MASVFTHQSDSLATLVDESGGVRTDIANAGQLSLKPSGAPSADAPGLVAAVAAAAAAAAIADEADKNECGNNVVSDKKDAPKPRRRLKETLADHADGLAVLIQKTKAISIQQDDANALPIGEDESSWLRALYSNDADECLWGLRKIRKYVCGDGSETHAQNLISWNALGRLLWLLQPSMPETILFETLWILTNIAAGPTAHTTIIVEMGFLPFLVKLLSHPRGSVRTQASWVIGNVVGDREGFRDIVLREGTLKPLLQIWEGDFPDDTARKEAFRIAMWVVDNMCRYKPDWHQMAPAFEILPNVLSQQDPFLLKECCWAIARILHQSGRHPVIDGMITKALCYRLVEILGYNNMLTTHPILRALINLASSKNPAHLQHILDAGLLDHLDMLLTDHYIPKSCRASLQIFVLQVLGNISSHRDFAPRIMSVPSLVSRVMDILAGRYSTGTRTTDTELRYEACYCIRNLVYHRHVDITHELVSLGVIELVLDMIPDVGVDSKVFMALIEIVGYVLDTIDRDQDRMKRMMMDELTARCVGTGTWVVTPHANDAEASSAAAAQESAATNAANVTPEHAPTQSAYVARVMAHGGIDTLVNTLIRVTGYDLDQMDEDAMTDGTQHASLTNPYSTNFANASGVDQRYHADSDEDDSDDEAGGSIHASNSAYGSRGTNIAIVIPLSTNQSTNTTGLHTRSTKQRTTPTLTLRQTISARIHRILVRNYPREFHERVVAAHMANDVLNGLGVLTMNHESCTQKQPYRGAYGGESVYQLTREFDGMFGSQKPGDGSTDVGTLTESGLVVNTQPNRSNGNRGARSMFAA